MIWPEFAVLLQNQIGLCKPLLQEASTESERGQSERGQLRRAFVFSNEDFVQSAISEVTRQVIQHIPKCAFKRSIIKFSRLQQIFAAGVANPIRTRLMTTCWTLTPSRQQNFAKLVDLNLMYCCSMLEWRAEECRHVALSRQAVYGCVTCHS
jgi:hypothetical protein